MPVRKINYKFTVIVLFSLLFSCENGIKIEDEELAKVYVDLLVVEDYYSDSDSLDLKRSEVFLKYSVREDQFDSNFKAFDQEPEKWENFFNLANTYLDSLKADLKNGNLKELP